jgi:hypothetical protein
MAVGEAGRRVFVGNTKPCPAEARAAVGGFTGVDVASRHNNRLRWRRQCGDLRVGDNAVSQS